MAQVINTNSLSLLTQNNLNKSQSSLGTAIERLSSGLRINSAKDDAAGQAIANRFTANIKGLTQASRNANDGISIAQTTEGSLSEINNNLQRVRELSVQATNGTNSDSDLKSIQAEITQRLGEIDRVSGQTQFNGVKVLASDQTLKIQVGANDGETIDINLKEITSKTLGLGNLDLTNQVSSKDFKPVTELAAKVDSVNTPATTVDMQFPPAAASGTLEVLTAATDTTKVGTLAVKVGTDYYEATYDSTSNKVSFDTSSAKLAGATGGGTTFVNGGTVTELADISGATQQNTAAAASFSVFRKDSDGSFLITDGTKSWSGANATINLQTGAVTLGTADATANTTGGTGYTAASNGDILTVPGSNTTAKAAVNADLTTVNAALKGTNALVSREVTAADGTKSTQYMVKNTNSEGKVSYYNATANKTNGAVTVDTSKDVVVDPLSAIDDALAQVDSLRSDLGAVQNRFDSTITNLGNTVNNLSSARSRIEDADYATEVSNMSRAQILQQAGTSVLAQANQVTQNVLSLLR
ncbi:flagellin [Enterobacter sp.]|uniref:flagellin N-terminal helical domain-containing protein n=1 Tax=Enterobacter sp. TaxID=42895 RepID=UPI00296F1793|nr:flagellin [Enterobacter sp.]